MPSFSRLFVLTAVVFGALVWSPAAGAAVPIPNDSLGIFVPGYEGWPAKAKRVDSFSVLSHPFMAANGRSNIHNDAYQTDTYTTPGPLGRLMSVNSTLRVSECASVTFDARGRIITICVGLDRPRLVMMDPNSLDEIASFDLPPRGNGFGDLFNAFTDFSGGGYFYLDNKDRAVVPTATRRIQVIGSEKYLLGLATRFKVEQDFDLTSAIPEGDKIVAVMPEWNGRIWWITKQGRVGNVNPSNGAVRVHNTGEVIANSFAVDETGGVFVVTDAALYRFDADASTGQPNVTWRETYPNIGTKKPGQTQAGSGTTPTLMSGGLLAYTDNADPMNVRVVKRDAVVSGPREFCAERVFDEGGSSTDQSLIAAGNSLFVENNYGYDGLLSTELGRSTTAGIAKVRVDVAGGYCVTEWVNNEISPSAVPKVSLSTGLLYTYTKRPRLDLVDAWYLTAIDACTGQTRFRKLAGLGPLYNNNFAPVSLAADGDAYVGVIGGLVRLRDITPPAGAPPASPSSPAAC